MKLLLKYLTISFISANIPWIGWGTIFFWPSIIGIALVLTYIEYFYKVTSLEMSFLALLTGFVLIELNCIGWGLIAHNSIMESSSMLILGLPSIALGSLLSGLFYRIKKV